MAEDVLVNDPEEALDLTAVRPVAGTVTLIPSTAPLSDEQHDRAIQDVKQLNVQFKLVSDQASKVVTLKEVEDQIGRDRSIDVARANVVQETFGDLYNEVSAKGFTRTPTRANFPETCRFMSKRVTMEERVLIDLYKVYLEEPLHASVAILEKVKTTHFPALIRVSESLASEIKTRESELLAKDSQVVPVGNEFLDLTTVNLLTLDTNQIRAELKSIHALKRSIQILQVVLGCPWTRSFFNRQLSKEPGDLTVSFVDLVRFIMPTSPEQNFVQALRVMDDDTSRRAIDVAGLVEQAKGLSDKPERISDFMLDYGERFVGFHDATVGYVTLVYRLAFLNTAIKDMLVTFYEL